MKFYKSHGLVKNIVHFVEIVLFYKSAVQVLGISGKNWLNLGESSIKNAYFLSKKSVSETISFLPMVGVRFPPTPTKRYTAPLKCGFSLVFILFGWFENIVSTKYQILPIFEQPRFSRVCPVQIHRGGLLLRI